MAHFEKNLDNHKNICEVTSNFKILLPKFNTGRSKSLCESDD